MSDIGSPSSPLWFILDYSISHKSHMACLCNTKRHKCNALCLPQSSSLLSLSFWTWCAKWIIFWR
jgi:hypothetical protein